MRRKYISLLKRYAKVEGLTSLKGVQNIHKIVNTVTDVILRPYPLHPWRLCSVERLHSCALLYTPLYISGFSLRLHPFPPPL